MANTYYDSQLTAAEIEAALEAIDGVIVPANNGKVLAINNGKLEARSVQWGGGSTVLEPLSVTANGDYTPEAGVDGFDEVHVSVPNSYSASDEGKVVSNGALVAQTARASQITQNGTYDTTLNNEVTVNVSSGGSAVVQSLSVTQNGTYNPPSGVDGYAPVTVNVSGGGSSNVLFGDGVPASSLGSDGDYYIRSGVAQKWIRIDIIKAARGTNYDFNYYGSRAISLVCKDIEQNEIEISPYILEQKYWKGSSLIPGGSNTTVFRSAIGNYVESNALPGHYAALYGIPNSFVLHKIKLTRRDNNSYHDYWRTFDIYQCDSEGNNLSLLLSEQDLTELDWNDWDSFTEFSPTGQLVQTQSLHEVYHKENGIWVAI